MSIGKRKAVLIAAVASVVGTAATIILVLKFSFASILAGFGLAAVDAQVLSKLKTSQRIVSQVKKRNKSKRAKAHTRFLKRTGKKLVVGSAAALSFGTAAVVVTTIGLEVEDYCDYLEDLENERALLNLQQSEFDMQACAESAKEDMDALAEHATSEGKKMLLDTLGIEG
ncbi:hypothetical protein A3742_09135 [Oleiphilus sp. HI0071]|uniref:hypothetical protein n=1 Tax=unclassified Oleiphilus TaxID=2631174 RepID=UPI0007C22479|nr:MULTISPECIES: hypothetical protein [unclassified Oleiphilus]KZY60198.1 hypothetical protein A3737_07220 [Oleiphilus sp. HI0065]KZY82510.1 hypothetical protein A3742_09135 [Oleiphilus sp. HI0071]KZY92849.1 hypothetical protein A3744_14330 [Oleiphilus sp. HI0073]KZZ44785.1 hypothetical protein A3758_02195 [Oleiphilus sp. HI0118]KZZ49684.1 hypothetical protein A3760_14925 [Oleiphilus sp. HI0122]KZZ75921.1 hypothetical protein A3765_10215 [Oleiphilus sp. HI0130]KZZ78837.1 hypothetical protein